MASDFPVSPASGTTGALYNKFSAALTKLNDVLAHAEASYRFECFPGEHSLRICRMYLDGNEDRQVVYIDDPNQDERTLRFTVKHGDTLSTANTLASVTLAVRQQICAAFDGATIETLARNRPQFELDEFSGEIVNRLFDNEMVTLRAAAGKKLAEINADLAGAGANFCFDQIDDGKGIAIYKVPALDDPFDVARIEPSGNSYELRFMKNPGSDEYLPGLYGNAANIGDKIQERLNLFIDGDIAIDIAKKKGTYIDPAQAVERDNAKMSLLFNNLGQTARELNAVLSEAGESYGFSVLSFGGELTISRLFCSEADGRPLMTVAPDAADKWSVTLYKPEQKPQTVKNCDGLQVLGLAEQELAASFDEWTADHLRAQRPDIGLGPLSQKVLRAVIDNPTSQIGEAVRQEVRDINKQLEQVSAPAFFTVQPVGTALTIAKADPSREPLDIEIIATVEPRETGEYCVYKDKTTILNNKKGSPEESLWEVRRLLIDALDPVSKLALGNYIGGQGFQPRLLLPSVVPLHYDP